MHFVLIARDGTDAGALQRRLAARNAHIENTERNTPHMVMGVATLDAGGGMDGSVMIVDFPDRAALDRWLAAEPYVTGDVWRDITVLPCRIGPSFLK